MYYSRMVSDGLQAILSDELAVRTSPDLMEGPVTRVFTEGYI